MNKCGCNQFSKFLLQAVTSLLILVLLFRMVPAGSLIKILASSNINAILAAFLLGAISIMLNGLRWGVLLRCLGYRYKLSTLVSFWFITLFFNVCIPGGVAGELMRTAILPGDGISSRSRQEHLPMIAASVFADKLVGLAGLMLLASVGIFFSFGLVWHSFVIPVTVSAALIIFFLSIFLFNERVQQFTIGLLDRVAFLSRFKTLLQNIFGSMRCYRHAPNVFLKALPLAVLSHLLVAAYFYILGVSIGVKIGLWKMLFFVPVIEFAASMPISIGGLGVREATCALLFSSQKVDYALSVSLSLLSFVVIILTALIGAVIFLRHTWQGKGAV